MQKNISYPKLRKENIIDKHGLSDPYQWLEGKLETEEVTKWISEQNSIIENYLSVPIKEKIRDRLSSLYNYEKYTCPFKYGNNYFFYHNSGLQNQQVLYIQETLESKPEILLDPNTLSTDGTISLHSLDFSDDGQFMAYSLSKSGSDWSTCYVKCVKTKENFPDKLEWLKFTGFHWTKDNLGFFYCRYPEQNIKEEDRGKEVEANKYMKLYYHKVGTAQESDVLVYETPLNPDYFLGACVSNDGDYLLINIYQGTDNESKIAIRKLDKIEPNMAFEMIVDDWEVDLEYITNQDEHFYFKTNYKAKNKQIIKLNLKQPQKSEWKTLVEESKNPLSSAYCFNDKYLILLYTQDVHDVLQLHNLEDGKFIKNIDMPSLGTISISLQKHLDEFFFKFTSFLYPGIIYRYSAITHSSHIFKEINVSGFNRDSFITKQVFYPSKDGTQIPMFIISRKDMECNGNNPFFIYGYGGFNIAINPEFNPFRLCLMENLKVSVAIANIRGGDEYGDFWHESAKKEKKQNCFDDFHCAAEYLIKNNYTNPKKIVINGGSNGGLLVGACINQRPDLYACAVACQGVFDMLRYHLYTIGYAWKVEYGDPDDPEDFKNLIKYCPIHNVKTKIQYPAVMIRTSEYDDRVVPIHSYKFISELQEKLGEDNERPLFLSVETKAGHGDGKPTTKRIDEVSEIYTFIALSLGLNYEE